MFNKVEMIRIARAISYYPGVQMLLYLPTVLPLIPA